MAVVFKLDFVDRISSSPWYLEQRAHTNTDPYVFLTHCYFWSECGPHVRHMVQHAKSQGVALTYCFHTCEVLL